MCLISYGKDIKTNAQLINLVTSIILRQKGEYTVDTIVNLALELSKGATIKVSKDKMYDIVIEKLDCLNRNDFISYRYGVFRTKQPYLPSAITEVKMRAQQDRASAS